LFLIFNSRDLQIAKSTLVIHAVKMQFSYIRVHMTNMKMILTAAGVAALVASPAMAKTLHHHVTHTATPADTRAATHQFITPYGADLPQPAHRVNGLNPDFQIGAEK